MSFLIRNTSLHNTALTREIKIEILNDWTFAKSMSAVCFLKYSAIYNRTPKPIFCINLEGILVKIFLPTSKPLFMIMMMMKKCFLKWFTDKKRLNLSWDHCRRFSLSQTSGTPWAGFKFRLSWMKLCNRGKTLHHDNININLSLRKKWSFALRISSVNMTKSEETLNRTLPFLCRVLC